MDHDGDPGHPGTHRPGLVVDGHRLDAEPGQTVLAARLAAGLGRTDHVGCEGQGVCGACRALVRRPGSTRVDTVLACLAVVEDGLHVTFLDRYDPRHTHRYDLAALATAADVDAALAATFPEAPDCRHCGGCDAACPVGLPVEAAVTDAVAGRLAEAAAAFDACVMCSLCTAACPEEIAPNHLGVFLRRALVRTGARPVDLTARLREVATGAMAIDLDGPDEDGHR